MKYRDYWPNAVGNEPYAAFIEQYRTDLKNELGLILGYKNEIDKREKNALEETIVLEKELMIELKHIGGSNAENVLANNLKKRILELKKTERQINDPRQEPFLRKLSDELTKQSDALLLANKDAPGVRLSLEHAKYLESKVKLLFKHYMALLSFIDSAIKDIDNKFKEEHSKLIKYERAEEKFISAARIHLSMRDLKIMKANGERKRQALTTIERAEEIQWLSHNDLVSLSNHLKKFNDFIYLRLNGIEYEFNKLNERMTAVNDYLAMEINDLAIHGRNSKRGKESLTITNEINQIRAYKDFLRMVLNILKNDEALISKNEEEIQHVLKNAYYQLVRQGKMRVA